MADNTQLSPGSGGDLIATDDLTTLNGGAVSGVKAQRNKMGFGDDGALRDVSDAYPFPIKLQALNYPSSGNNNFSGALAAGASDLGGIETIQNQQALQIAVTCDQPFQVVLTQYSDLAGTKQAGEPIVFNSTATAGLRQNVKLVGNYYRRTITNLNPNAAANAMVDITFGVMDTLPEVLGRLTETKSMSVALSNEDAHILLSILQALGPLLSARGASGELRISGAVSTVTTVTTLSNQTSVGGYSANNQIPALMNSAAVLSNINNMIG